MNKYIKFCLKYKQWGDNLGIDVINNTIKPFVNDGSLHIGELEMQSIIENVERNGYDERYGLSRCLRNMDPKQSYTVHLDFGSEIGSADIEIPLSSCSSEQ